MGSFVQGPGLLPGPSVALHLTKVLSPGCRDLNRDGYKPGPGQLGRPRFQAHLVGSNAHIF